MSPKEKIEEMKRFDLHGFYKKMYFNARNQFMGDYPDTIDMDHPENFKPADHDWGIFLMTSHACDMLMDLHKRLDKIEEVLNERQN